MFGSPPPEENLPKIEGRIRKLSTAIIALEQVRIALDNENPKPANYRELNAQFNNHLINLKNTRTLLEDAKDPGFFAMLRRGSQILEVQFNPEMANTTQSIKLAEAFSAQIKIAIQQNHVKQQPARERPERTSPVLVSSRERRTTDPVKEIYDLYQETKQFYMTKLDGKIPAGNTTHYVPSEANAHMIQYDDRFLRQDINARCKDIEIRINNLGDRANDHADIIGKLKGLVSQLREDNGKIANLPDRQNASTINAAPEPEAPRRPSYR